MKEIRGRLYLFILFIFFLYIVLWGRVTFLAFYNGKISAKKIKYRIQRGIIYDRRGIELALSQDSSTIGIQPGNIYDPLFTAEQLAGYLDIRKERITELISKKTGYFLLKRELDNKTADRIRDLALPGIRVEKEFKRVYPQGTLAANLIGFAGRDDDNALAGLENHYQDELLSTTDVDTLKGNNIHLTIDSLIQHKLEVALKKAFVESRSKKAVGVFIDVHTGKILAMASFPNFDPNEYYNYMPEYTTNWAIRHVYEPGSTMKIFMAMILMNEHLLLPEETFHCPGHIEFGSRKINCGKKHGDVNIEEILQYSCNVGIIKAVQKIPVEVLHKYLARLKFGKKSGVLPNENRGYLAPLEKWHPSTPYYLAIGQGISVTPVQLVTSAAAAVNGGKIFEPYIVSHVTDSYGQTVRESSTTVDDAGIHENTTSELLRAMVKVVQAGTGQNAFLQDYAIAGKTGTGQKAVPGQGYKDGLWSASFLGFFPADKPKIAGLILFDEPGGDIYSGGGIAAPVFKQTVAGIIPIIEKSNEARLYTLKKLPPLKYSLGDAVPDFSGLTLRESIMIMNEAGTDYSVKGSGFCISQDPLPGKNIKQKENWKLYFKN